MSRDPGGKICEWNSNKRKRSFNNAHHSLASEWFAELEPHDNLFLATLAARLTGDSHALDRGKPLSNLVLRASGNPDRRTAWSDLGVVIDDLSAPALCLNLPAAKLPWKIGEESRHALDRMHYLE